MPAGGRWLLFLAGLAGFGNGEGGENRKFKFQSPKSKEKLNSNL
jgi:hypothetical protein